MNIVDSYSCSFSKKKTELHDSTDFVFVSKIRRMEMMRGRESLNFFSFVPNRTQSRKKQMKISEVSSAFVCVAPSPGHLVCDWWFCDAFLF